MTLRINVLWYNRFIFRHRSPYLDIDHLIFVRKTGPIYLVAGRLAGRQVGWQAGTQTKYR